VITTTGFSRRSAKRVIANPSELPYRPGQRVVWVKAEFGLNSSGSARIGQCLLGRDEVIDSILMMPSCLIILRARKHSDV